MKSKEILLWVVAIGALVLSLITIIGPKGLKSDAAMRTAQISSVQNASPVTLNNDSADMCIKKAKQANVRCYGGADAYIDNVGTGNALDRSCNAAYTAAVLECARRVEPLPTENNY